MTPIINCNPVTPPDYKSSTIELARSFLKSLLGHQFTDLEEAALKPFFTNLRSRIFFMRLFPANVVATMTAMYSRMKNPRGIRGTFVDSFLPNVLASHLQEIQPVLEAIESDDSLSEEEKDQAQVKAIEKWLKERHITSLNSFVGYSSETRELTSRFIEDATKWSKTIGTAASARKTRAFLRIWLDKYGHNSIARMGSISICFENVSILLAKELEWPRPGVGIVETSTRYVTMGERDQYPIWWELENEEIVQAAYAESLCGQLFEGYCAFVTDDPLSTPFGRFLANTYGDQTTKSAMEAEIFDVAGNLLPASTLTSLAITLSGEALSSLLKCLRLSGIPEGIAAADLIEEEAAVAGDAQQFVRHAHPTDWERAHHTFLPIDTFISNYNSVETQSAPFVWLGSSSNQDDITRLAKLQELTLLQQLETRMGVSTEIDLPTLLKSSAPWMVERGSHDKLPPEFEALSLVFFGIMSFRSWRDTHRMSLNTHNRSLLTPALGIYKYWKPGRHLVNHVMQDHLSAILKFWSKHLSSTPRSQYFLLQYLCTLGCNVGFSFGGNLRQHEFVLWRRAGKDTHDEVRQVALQIDEIIQSLFPSWWRIISRTDRTPGYAFARGKAIPLEMAT